MQLYLTDLSLLESLSGAVTDQSAQAEYLGNPFVVTADQSGFSNLEPATQVQVNIERVGGARLAFLDRKGDILVTTPGTPPLDSRLHDFARGTNLGSRGTLDLYLGPS